MVVSFEGMPERSVESYFVDVVSTLLVTDHVPSLDEIGHDAVHSSFPDSHQTCHVHEADIRVLRDAQQHMSVIGEKRPRRDIGVAAGRAQFHGTSVPRTKFLV